jgi:hypothetical protein
MDDRAFWHTDPEGLLVGAAQALEAKRGLARYLDCHWVDVDAAVPEAMVSALRRMPPYGRLRRVEDRALLSWLGRLLPEVPGDHPLHDEIRRRLRAKLGGRPLY